MSAAPATLAPTPAGGTSQLIAKAPPGRIDANKKPTTSKVLVTEEDLDLTVDIDSEAEDLLGPDINSRQFDVFDFENDDSGLYCDPDSKEERLAWKQYLRTGKPVPRCRPALVR